MNFLFQNELILNFLMWVYYEVLNVDEMSLVRYNRCMLYV